MSGSPSDERPAVKLTFTIQGESSECIEFNYTNVTTERLGLAEGAMPVKVCPVAQNMMAMHSFRPFVSK